MIPRYSLFWHCEMSRKVGIVRNIADLEALKQMGTKTARRSTAGVVSDKGMAGRDELDLRSREIKESLRSAFEYLRGMFPSTC